MNIRTIVDCLACIGEILLVQYFFSSFVERRISKKMLICVNSALVLTYIVIMQIVTVEYFLFISSLAITIGLAFCYDFKWYAAIFFGIIISVISGLFELVVMQIVTLNGTEFRVINENIYAYIGGLISSKSLTFLLIVIIRKAGHKSFQSIKGMRFCELLLLPISTILISIISSYTMFIIGIPNSWKVFSIIAMCFLISSNVMIFYIIDTQYELISTKEKLKAGKVFLENQKQYYNDIFQSQQEVRRTRHDLKSIFIAIMNELGSGNTDQAINMIQRKLGEMEGYIDFSDKTDNVIDAVIHSKIKYAQNKQVVLNINKNTNQPIKIDNLDLAVLIANVLDNAIEAAAQVEENREVTFSMITENDNLLLLSKNPTINKISSGESLHTTKLDKKNHGFGVMSIQAIAKQYSGNCLYECIDGVFSSTIIVQNKQLGI